MNKKKLFTFFWILLRLKWLAEGFFIIIFAICFVVLKIMLSTVLFTVTSFISNMISHVHFNFYTLEYLLFFRFVANSNICGNRWFTIYYFIIVPLQWLDDWMHFDLFVHWNTEREREKRNKCRDRLVINDDDRRRTVIDLFSIASHGRWFDFFSLEKTFFCFIAELHHYLRCLGVVQFFFSC